MRAQSLTLAVAGAALLASTAPPATTPVALPATTPVALPATTPVALPVAGPVAGPRVVREGPVARSAGDVRAADLLARVRDCVPVSRGRYRSDDGTPASTPVCGTRDAVFWRADLDIDCDGRAGRRCNRRSDPLFSDATAFPQSDGRQLDAERLPYIVVPGPSRIWNHGDDGVRGGSVAAVVHRDRVRYAVVGDVGPRDVIGEASYAAAKALGIRPDPRGGGTDSGVTYIVFKDTRVAPIENHAAAVMVGERLARQFVRGR